MSKTYPALSKEERQMAAFSAKAITSALEKKQILRLTYQLMHRACHPYN
mgnify:CR=1 FL=1